MHWPPYQSEPQRHSVRRSLLAIPVALVAALGLLAALSAAGERPIAPVEEEEEVADVSAAPPAVAALAVAPAAQLPVVEHQVTEGSIERGTTLFRSLLRQGVAPSVIHTISTEMKPHFDFRRAMPGHSFHLTRDAAGELVRFRYRTSSTKSYQLVKTGEGYRVERREEPLVPRPVRLKGVVTSTLYQSMVDLGERGQLARDFADVFAWDVDFQRAVRPGDTYEVLYERLHRDEGDGALTYVRPGRILAARYAGAAGDHTAVYFEPSEGRGGYYRPDGSSVQREFLMSPLHHGRISSAYSAARRHPILKVTRPHHGIDYAAPAGTPVWAVADGEVTYKAWAGGFGQLVKIRHRSGDVSYYAHLSRFAKGLRVGDQVGQKQVIGYVGQTGLATGPHVCFRVARDGKYVNPRDLKTPAGKPIPAELKTTFTATRDLLLANLGGGTTVARAGTDGER